MSSFCRRSDGDAAAPPTYRLVNSADAAVERILSTAHDPPRPEVVVLVLTPDFLVHAVLVVDDTRSPDAVVEVIELVTESVAEAGREALLVVGSVRPGLGPLPGDVDRWTELSDLAETHGCELLEWFVISDGIAWCPTRLPHRTAAMAGRNRVGVRCPLTDGQAPWRCRRCSGVRRKPAARKRRSSSREPTSTAPARTMSGR